MRNHDLALSLEEFGLSRYEAKAYLTLLAKGTLSASELAYYANIPRTKVYSTLTKLSKKRLITITQDKPLVCSAVSADGAFGEILAEQESKIGGMKNIIAKLEKIGEESNKPHGVEERRYLVLGPDSALVTLKELILNAKKEIACVIDGWGLRIISQCKHAMLKSIANKINVKILAGKDSIGNDILSSIPHGASVRIGDIGVNLFIFDKSTIVIVDSNNGKGALFRATDVLGSVHSKIFDVAWTNAMDASFLIPLGKELADTATKLVSAISRDVCGCVADSIMTDGVKQPNIVHVLESNGIRLTTIGISDMLKVINASLGMACSASLSYDKISNMITIESNGNGKHVMPWALLLSNYLEYNDIRSKTLAGCNNGKDFVNIKLEKTSLK